MYKIIEVDGKLRWPIDEKNKANPYGKPKAFKTYAEATYWIKRHTYGGMSFHYEIKWYDE